MAKKKIKCDAFGCEESFPLEHEALGETGFALGKWLGWVFVDFNRPDLFDRQMRFCSLLCLLSWIRLNASYANTLLNTRVSPDVVQMMMEQMKRA